MPLQIGPRARLLTKSGSLRQIQDTWSIRWTLRRNVVNKSSNINNFSTTTQSLNGPQQTKQKKGKLSKLRIFHAKWSWKAGVGWIILSVLDWWLLAIGGWFTWSGLLMRWTPIGACIIATIEWQLHNRRLEQLGLPKTASTFQAGLYCSLPLRLMSRCWGWIADCNVPTPLRPYVYGLYANKFNVNLDEAASTDLKDYRSLAEFFTRPLKDGVRCIDEKSKLVSPADGKVLHFGSASSNQIEQVKGVTYNLEVFLGPDTWVESKEKSAPYLQNIKVNKDENTALYQCVIYLAPGDYHRFHSPAQWEPKLRRHFTGELLSVNPNVAQWLPGLFCLNERATYIGKWMHGFFSFTAVGATNVGSVQIYFDEKLKTNKWVGVKVNKKLTEFDELNLPSNIQLKKGELVGQFNMGSTIVLVFEAPKHFKFTINAGQKIKVGESLGHCECDRKSAESSPSQQLCP